MTDSSNIKKNKLTLKSLKESYFKLLRKISSNYLCLEFGYDYVQIGEAYYSKGKVNFKKIIRKEIPVEALEKGVPSDPEAMSELIASLLSEEKIYIKRAAVVLSPDSFFTRLIDIPNSVKDKSIYNYLTNPSSSIQIPITISNTDFNIYKTSQESKEKESNLFFFVASRKIVIENILKTCEKINLDLNYVEIGFNSLSRLINYEELFDKNDENQYLIMLELLPNCTYLTIFDKSSPIMINRLASIRKYPMRIGEISKSDNSDYLSISKLDLKVLVKEIKSTLNDFLNFKEKNCSLKIALTGINSMHPNLCKILSECIKLPVYQFAPKSNLLLGDVNYISEDYYDITFARLFGLGIGLLSNSEIKENQTLTDSKLVNFAEPETKSMVFKNDLNNNQMLISKDKLSGNIKNDDSSLLKRIIKIHINLKSKKMVKRLKKILMK